MTNDSQVKVRLITRDTELVIPEAPLLVPVSLKRYGLSEVVNRLLEQQSQENEDENSEEYLHVPFDFLVDGELLRTSLDEYLTSKGVSTETVVTLEYTRSILPPSYLASYSHPDWVSAVDIFNTTRFSHSNKREHGSGTQEQGVALESPIVTGSYDGVIRLWNKSGHVSHQLVAHNGAIKAIKWTGQDRLVSGSADRTLCLWKTVLPEDASNTEDTINSHSSIVALLRGHTAAINSLAVNANTGSIVSASADGTLKIWSTNYKSLPQYTEETVSTSTATQKRRRLASASLPSARSRGASATLSGHSSSVEGVVFHATDAQVVHSVGQDHTIRTWDLATASQIDSRTTSFPLLSITTLPELNLLACGSSARHVTLHDPRSSNNTTLTQATLVGHANFVVDLAPSPVSQYMLASASHDGTARVWDVRAQKCLYVLPRQSGQKGPGGAAAVFGVDWDQDIGIVSCGKDKQLQINSSTQMK